MRPGNHDVNRDAHSLLNSGLRESLRAVPPAHVESLLPRMFSDTQVSEILHAPFTAYNDFAKPYNSATTAESPVPPPWELELDGRPLLIDGVNSALVCDERDSHKQKHRKVVLGVNQLVGLADHPDAISILMCHHPVRWLRDADAVRLWLNRPHVLLTGHEHKFKVKHSADERSLHIASGAVNPERSGAAWAPAYNILDLELDGDALVVSVSARLFGERAMFEPPAGQSEPDIYRVRLGEVSSDPPDKPDPGVPIEPPRSTGDRDLVFDILTASPDIRAAAARRVGLLADGEGLVGDAAERRVLTSARDRGLLEEFAQAVREETRSG